jgi:mono/diheme cytochrome c family protein
MLLLFPMVAMVSLSCSSEQPVEGEVLYRLHCASCHGISGKGDGVVAEFLSPRPTDLTVFSREQGGDYPARDVMKAVDGTRTVQAHGDSAMPVWGRVFEEHLQDAPYTQRTTLLHLGALVEYIRTLQQE